MARGTANARRVVKPKGERRKVDLTDNVEAGLWNPSGLFAVDSIHEDKSSTLFSEFVLSASSTFVMSNDCMWRFGLVLVEEICCCQLQVRRNSSFV